MTVKGDKFFRIPNNYYLEVYSIKLELLGVGTTFSLAAVGCRLVVDAAVVADVVDTGCDVNWRVGRRGSGWHVAQFKDVRVAALMIRVDWVLPVYHHGND